ncbi:O-antigen ligase family protein [Flavobacteriales bacterium]|nr:O-antigen ligase family protein [Flavobacteriales bacterium]
MFAFLQKKNALNFLLAGFILIQAIGIAFEFYVFMAIPFVLMIAYLAFYHLNILYYLLIFMVPFSVNVEKLTHGVGMILPTEPVLFGLLLVFSLKLIRDGFTKEIIRHPITIIILLQTLWIFLTTLTSEIPLVSIKFLLARLWFLATFYFIASQVLIDGNKMTRMLWMYVIPLSLVVAYTIIHHSMYAFEEKPGHWVMSPFFKDHTSYGAILAMIFPFLVWQTFRKDIRSGQRALMASVLVFFTVAVILSYTRAAWLSLAGAMGLYLIFKLKVKGWMISSVIVSIFAGVIMFWTPIMHKLSKNKQDSSSSISEHLESMSNVSSDASNLERLNRWNAAWKMFLDFPIAGAGPGTYAFVYAPYQDPEDKTIISTNAGDAGNAHSEYLGPLSEMGLLGMLFVLALLSSVIYYGYKLNKKIQDAYDRGVFLSIYLGLMTYFAHGFLNNYLDTDKASALFWGFIVVLVVLDLRTNKIEA